MRTPGSQPAETPPTVVGWVRLDDRLVHAEVIYACLDAWRPTRVVVATTLPWVQVLDPAVLDHQADLVVLSPTELGGPRIDEQTLVVLGTPDDLAGAIQAGFCPPLVRLANRSRRSGTRALSPTYYVDERERRLLSELQAGGMAVVLQRVPSDPLTTWWDSTPTPPKPPKDPEEGHA